MKIIVKYSIVFFSILVSINCHSLFNFGFVNNSIKKHAEVYQKFLPEWESNNIKVERRISKLAILLNLLRSRTSPIVLNPLDDTFYSYRPNTPHLKAYLDAFEQMDGRIKIQDGLKGLLFGIVCGFLTGAGVHKVNDNKAIFVLSMLTAAFISPIASILHENNRYGEHPYLDIWLRKYNNYFSNISWKTMKRVLLTYSCMIFTATGSGILAFNMLDE